jgi:drug/metabolite transporter (DMT)-like permease
MEPVLSSGDRSAPRRAMRGRLVLLTFLVTILNPLGNFVLAWGMKHLPEQMGVNALGYVRAMFHPAVAFGILLLILWTLLRMSLMSWADLTFILPVTSLGYVLSAVLGRLFLNETVSPRHWAGTLFILLGAALAAMQPASDESRTKLAASGD